MNLQYNADIANIFTKMKDKPADKFRLIASALNLGMTWCDTPEGDDYWRGVHNKLVERAKKLEKSCVDETKYASVVRIAIDLTKAERMQLLSLLRAGVEGEAVKAASEGEQEVKKENITFKGIGKIKKKIKPLCDCVYCNKAREDYNTNDMSLGWSKEQKMYIPKPPYKAGKSDMKIGSLSVDALKKAKEQLRKTYPEYIYDPKTGKTTVYVKPLVKFSDFIDDKVPF